MYYVFYIMYYGQKFNRLLSIMDINSIDPLPKSMGPHAKSMAFFKNVEYFILYILYLYIMYHDEKFHRFPSIMNKNSIDSLPIYCIMYNVLWTTIQQIPFHYGQKSNRFPSHILCIMYNVLWTEIQKIPFHYGQEFNRFPSKLMDPLAKSMNFLPKC